MNVFSDLLTAEGFYLIVNKKILQSGVDFVAGYRLSVLGCCTSFHIPRPMPGPFCPCCKCGNCLYARSLNLKRTTKLVGWVLSRGRNVPAGVHRDLSQYCYGHSMNLNIIL